VFPPCWLVGTGLQRHGGKWRDVPYELKVICANRNPNDLTTALELAKRKYEENPNLFV
jgi:hypothetical protein